MKRLIGLVVMFLVLGVCAPSYGYVLVYNMSGSFRGLNGDTRVLIPWKGFLTLDICDESGDLANAGIIMYGKDSSKRKVFAEHDLSANGYLAANLQDRGNYTSFEFWVYDIPFFFEGLVQGKISMVDAGLPGRVDIPRSMIGINKVVGGMMFDERDDLIGISSLRISFSSAESKFANRNDLEIGHVSHNLKEKLEIKGYNDVFQE